MDELSAKKVFEHVMKKRSLYLSDAEVCDQKTKVLHHSIKVNTQSNSSRTPLHLTMEETDSTVENCTTSITNSQDTTVCTTVRPEVGANGESASLGNLSVGYTRRKSDTKMEEKARSTEQHIQAIRDLPAQSRATSTSRAATEKHSCTLKDIEVPIDALKSCKEEIKYTVAYTKVGDPKKHGVPKSPNKFLLALLYSNYDLR